MTYNTPELLQVGSAQNLVLGGLDKFDAPDLNRDDIGGLYDPAAPIADDSSW